jgi:signal transduction histidine kinase
MNNNITLLVITGIIVMLGLMLSVLAAVMFNFRKKNQHRKALEQLKEQQQNQLIEAAIRSEETERHRISETLHDEVGAILSSAKLHLLGIKQTALDEKDKKLHDKGAGLLNDVIKRVRGISHSLHSNILKEFGFNEAVRHFLQQVTGGTLISTDTQLDEAYKGSTPEQDMSLYRIIQELINNTIKYAGATTLEINSTLVGQELVVNLVHNGNGLSQEDFETYSFRKEGLGLKNIRNRVLLLKGNISFFKTQDNSTVRICLPLQPKPTPHA